MPCCMIMLQVCCQKLRHCVAVSDHDVICPNIFSFNACLFIFIKRGTIFFTYQITIVKWVSVLKFLTSLIRGEAGELNSMRSMVSGFAFPK